MIDWVLRRVDGDAGARNSALGAHPRREDLDLSGVDLDPETFAELMTVDRKSWLMETDLIADFFAGFDRVPECSWPNLPSCAIASNANRNRVMLRHALGQAPTPTEPAAVPLWMRKGTLW